MPNDRFSAGIVRFLTSCWTAILSGTAALFKPRTNPSSRRFASSHPASQRQRLALERGVKSAQTEHRSRRFKSLLVQCLPTLAAGWMLTLGLLNDAAETATDDLEGVLTALIGATAGAVTLGAATTFLLGMSADTPPKLRWSLGLLALVLIIFIGLLSTVAGIRGYSGPGSIVWDLRDNATAWSGYTEARTEDSNRARSSLATLQPLRDSICGMAGMERKSGAVTGSAAPGAVSNAYASACLQVTTIVNTLDETTKETDRRRERLTALLGDLHEIPDNASLHVFERKAAFRDKTGEIRQVLDAASSEDVRKRLKAQLEMLHKTGVPAVGLKDGAFGQRQEAAVADLKTSLGDVVGIVEEFLGEDANQSVAMPPQLLDTASAVFKYWKRNISAIALAVGCDFVCLFFAALLFVSRATISVREEALVIHEEHEAAAADDDRPDASPAVPPKPTKSNGVDPHV